MRIHATKRLSAASSALAILLVAALAGCSTSAEGEVTIVSGPGGDASLTVANQSDFVLFELYIAEEDNPTWGPNLLGADPLFPGGEITVTDIRCDFYDVLVVDELGAECELLSVDLCFNDTFWDITNATLSTCPIFRARLEEGN